MKAVTGEYIGTAFDWLPSTQTTWADWLKKHPNTRVLSTKTGFRRDYTRNPYAGYGDSDRTYFPVPHTRKELSKKTWIAGILIAGQAKAYPLATLPEGHFTDTIGAKEIALHWEPQSGTLAIRDANDKAIPVVHAYWFAWQAFYPETMLWQKKPGIHNEVE
jgi:hypothetical protein